jgi:hypothetical protein
MSITPAMAVHISRPGTPNSTTAKRGNYKARDDRGVDAGFWLNAGRNGKSHRERERDEADGEAGNEIRKQVLPRISRQNLQ